MFIPIIKSLCTLGIIITAGWFGRRSKIFSPQDTKVFSNFIYNFSLPALFFVEIAGIDFKLIGYMPIMLSLFPLISIIFVLFVLKAARLISKKNFILLGLSIVFGSNAFFGIPFFESLYGKWGLDMAVITGSFLSIFGIVMSLLLFEYAARAGKGLFFILKILKSPLIISILLGIIFYILGPKADFLIGIISPLGKTAPGIAIFMLGMFIHDHFSLPMAKKALPFALFRILILPLVTFGILLVFHSIKPELKSFLILQSGIPAAISIAIFSERYKYKTPELTGMVVLTSLSSFLVLGILYFLSMALR